MEKANIYEIALPKGEASRPFFELSEKERHAVGLKIFQQVTELAAGVGSLPVISQHQRKAKAETVSAT